MSRLSLRSAALACISTALLALTGCGTLSQTSLTTTPAAALGGRVFGGNQPVTASTVAVWQVGTSGFGSAATKLAQTTTDASGAFLFAANAYTCPSPTTQVYLTAQGGYATPAYANPNIMLIAGLGNCAAARTATVNINEVSTVVTALALGRYFPFGAGTQASYGTTVADSIGTTSADLPALTLANVHTIPLLVDLPSGFLKPSTPALTIESAKIYSLANTIAACVNDSSTFTNCARLYSDTTPYYGDAPTDTLQAAVAIASNPWQQVSDLYSLGSPQAPFVGLASAPNDWTIAVAYTSSSFGLGIAANTSTNIDIDASGRVWFPSTLPGASGIGYLDPSTGTFGGPFLASAATQPQYVTVDPSGNVWFTDQASSKLSEYIPSVPASSISASTGSGTLGPVAADGYGNIFFSNNVGGTPYLAEVDTSLNLYPTLGQFNLFPTGIDVVSFSTTSTPTPSIFAATSYGGYCAGEELDYEYNYTGGLDVSLSGGCVSGGSTIAQLNNDGVIVGSNLNQICSAAYEACEVPGPTPNLPQAIATDGYGNSWLANSGSASVTLFGGISDGYDQLVPSSYLHGPANGNTMSKPYGLAIDGSGNVWVSNAGCVSTTATPCTPGPFTLTELLGAAGPTIAPLSAQGFGNLSGTLPGVYNAPSTSTVRFGLHHGSVSPAAKPNHPTGIPWLTR